MEHYSQTTANLLYSSVPKIISRNKQHYRHTQLASKINPELEVW